MLFADIKEGDRVGFRSGPRDNIFTTAEVTHTTPKYFDAGGSRYAKSDGIEVKRSRMLYRRRALRIDDEFLAAKAEAETEAHRQKLAYTLESTLHRLPLEALEAIAAIVAEAEAKDE